MSEEEFIDKLLDQATSFAKKTLADDSFVDFDFTRTNTTSFVDIQNGQHDLIEVREDKGGGQRGIYAKCDIEAGTNLVVTTPIVIFWDVEEDSDDEDGIHCDLDAMVKGQLGSDDSGNEDDDDGSVGSCEYYLDSDGRKIIDVDAELEKFVDKKLNPGSKTGANLKTPECNQADDNIDDHDHDNDSIQEATGTKRNGILILRCIEKIKEIPSLWTDTLSKLFPRDIDAALTLPPWFCSDPTIGMQIEAEFNELQSLSLFQSKENDDVCKDMKLRLPLIVRYNVLSIETCSELFVYPNVSKGGMAKLAGTGLFGPEASYFNHSCIPNVSRYSIGDVMFFVTNRNVHKGQELCFSYIEHEFLCENAAKRNAMLDMDFELEDNDDTGSNGNGKGKRPFKKQKVAKMQSSNKEDDEFHYPMIGTEVQNELMAAPAPERLELINELLDQVADEQDYKCDKFQLHILKAITLDGMGNSRQALPEWETAVEFAVNNFPPLDETTIALRVQAALCALSGVHPSAKRHANAALQMHISLFGGGNARFRKRYKHEFSCPLRPNDQVDISANVNKLFGVTAS